MVVLLHTTISHQARPAQRRFQHFCNTDQTKYLGNYLIIRWLLLFMLTLTLHILAMLIVETFLLVKC